MTNKEVIEVIRNEIKCVERADNCNRDCYNCDLLMDTEDILAAYYKAIECLELLLAMEDDKK